jgi:hypothetical protein
MTLAKLSRALHRWGSILVLIPVLMIALSGIVLQWKKASAYLQPPTRSGTGSELALSFSRILELAKTVPAAQIDSWHDIDRLDVRPEKGIVKVRAKNSWEIQLDTQTGEILQVAVRRSDLIESLHDGSYFHEHAKLWVFFPTGLMLLILVLTGLHLFCLPYLARRLRKY